ncbi:MAG TPA: phosphatidylserine/phosphatidylglycerophosphate/cardiolipin synthase family protein [Gaiellaceae bacterium]|jgi:phosphatidylserine/phosphatidylglycerophosphate/cardiolipin synthase-like enzyme|nr:phosphatidylserine/phosphatidylglycerophosphate/cardiolipin synthase family protein [Gaiellaceae bacterium]
MLEVRTLTDGGQEPPEVMAWITDFVRDAQRTLDFAHYDLNVGPENAAALGGAIRAAAARGVAIRFLYNLDHRNPIPVPPPPEPDGDLIASWRVPVRAIAGVPDLMHHKYVVRDRELVWTGSMNWTDDSFARQENVLVIARSPELAARFTEDFEQLWQTGAVERSGFVAKSFVPVGAHAVRAWFTPGHGAELSHRIATAIARAKRVRICSPVITSAPVLSALAQGASEGKDIAGCVDAPQIGGVVHQWNVNGNVYWKLPLLRRALRSPFSGKRSNPWRPGPGLHDFMHAKVTICDDVVFVGSYNLSRSGEKNAENVLELKDAALAERLAAYIDEVRGRYPALDLASS